MKIREPDPDEPGMLGYGENRVDIVGQVSFYFKARRFQRKKLVKALVSDTHTREILLSWQTLLKWGIISESFPYPPGHNGHNDPPEVDEDVTELHFLHHPPEVL